MRHHLGRGSEDSHAAPPGTSSSSEDSRARLTNRPISLLFSLMRKGEVTRTRMVEAAADAFEREGYSGAALTAILEASDAPRGSLYFHFPGGKEELAVAAIDASATRLALDMAAALRAAKTAASGLARVIDLLADRLEASGFEKGCPITSIVSSSASAPAPVRAAVADAMGVLEASLSAFLARHGVDEREAAQKATVTLAAIEGALLLARIRRSREPLSRVSKSIGSILGG